MYQLATPAPWYLHAFQCNCALSFVVMTQAKEIPEVTCPTICLGNSIKHIATKPCRAANPPSPPTTNISMFAKDAVPTVTLSYTEIGVMLALAAFAVLATEGLLSGNGPLHFVDIVPALVLGGIAFVTAFIGPTIANNLYE